MVLMNICKCYLKLPYLKFRKHATYIYILIDFPSLIIPVEP